MLCIIMDKATLRPLVLGILRKTPQTHLHAIENEIRRQTDEYERHDVLAVQEILWELLVQGVLAPGKNSLNLNLPFVHVTEFGTECLEDGVALVHDPDGYIAGLESACGDACDPIVVETTREALLTYLAGRYAPAMVLLARSAERVIERAAEAAIRHGHREDHGVRRLEEARSNPQRLAAALRRALASWHLPPPFAEDVEPELAGIATVLDAARTAEGRFRLPRVDRETVFAHLLLFPGHCRFVYDLVVHLEGEPAG